MEISVAGFSKEFTSVNLELKQRGQVFSETLIAIYTLHLNEGFKVGKINKTTKKGTKVKYVPIKSDEELKDHIEEINKMIEENNEKYNAELRKLTLGGNE
jgi:hypothetical protein